jgi:hypothetical protein
MLHEVFLALVGYSDSLLTQVYLIRENLDKVCHPFPATTPSPSPFCVQVLLLQLHLNIRCYHHTDTLQKE